MSLKKTIICLLVILLTGFYLRSGIGLHWDDGQHLHPDERFLTMVTNDISMPSSIGEYLDSSKSPLSPYNKNYGFFVYGTFPIFLTKVLAGIFNYDEYGLIPILGRVLSALFDLATMLVIFLIGRHLYSVQAGLLAAAFLAFSVLNIQLSHFYGVETQSAFFVALTFYLGILSLKKQSLEFKQQSLFKKILLVIFSGLSLGLALASKISSVYFLPILGIVMFLPIFEDINPKVILSKLGTKATWKRITAQSFSLLFILILAALTFRIFQPYAFSGSSIFDFSLGERFVANMNEIRGAMKGADMPPSIQWVDRPAILFSLYNLVVWGLGIFLGATVCAGTAYMLYEIFLQGKIIHVLPLSWALFWFLYQSTQFVKAGRYLSIIYPFLVLIAAYFLTNFSLKNYNVIRIRRLTTTVVLVFTFFWACSFTSIYSRQHSRIQASFWIFDNIPCGTKIANEHWDDGLPLRVGGKDGFGGCYKGLEFNHYWPDDEKKLKDTLEKIKDTDYIILSSNRLYLSIPRLPKRFPFTIEYYKMLFSGELGFDLEKEFSSYPSMGPIQFSSDNAEEPFTVYDHPKVFIFKKNPKRFNFEKVKERLSSFPPGIHEPLVP